MVYSLYVCYCCCCCCCYLYNVYCICVCIYIYIHIHTYMCAYVYVCVCILYTYTHIHTHIYIYTCVCVYVYIYIYTHIAYCVVAEPEGFVARGGQLHLRLVRKHDRVLRDGGGVAFRPMRSEPPTLTRAPENQFRRPHD